MRHWEATGLATAGGLSAWTAAGGTVWAIAALVAAGVTLALVAFPSPQWNRARSRRLPLLLALVGMMGALGALVAARRIRDVETNWPAQTARKARNPLLEVPLSSVTTMAAV